MPRPDFLKYGSVSSLLDAVKREKEMAEQDDALEEYERMARKVVSVRLDATDIYKLELVSKQMQLTRTACAQELLETAIAEMFYGLDLKGAGFHLTSGENGSVVVTVDGTETFIVQDDAIMIGGGEDK